MFLCSFQLAIVSSELAGYFSGFDVWMAVNSGPAPVATN